VENANNTMLTQRDMKHSLLAALEGNDLEAIQALALANRTVLSMLVRLAYDKTSLVGWRAITAIGVVSTLFVRNNYDFLRDTIRKLLWSLSDESGGIGWSAPEILGEIVCADPRKFSDIVPLIAEVYDIEEKVFRPGILYALGRIAGIDSSLVLPFKDIVVSGLSNSDPLARLYALDLSAKLRDQLPHTSFEEFASAIRKLTGDTAEGWIYENGGFIGLTVADKAKYVMQLFKA
jgi:hypothetical protein